MKKQYVFLFMKYIRTRKISFLIIVLLQLFFTTIHAQKLPPVYEIKTDTAISQVFENYYWQILPDKAGTWTINNVSKSSFADSFYRRDSAPKKRDTIANTYWVRYRIKNTMNANANISLDSYSEQDDFYVFDSTGSYKHFRTGQIIRWPDKDGLKLDNVVPLVLTPGEEITVYARAYNRIAGIPGSFVVDIANTTKVMEKDYVPLVEGSTLFEISDMQNVFLIGVLFIAMLFNLFFFFIAKEKEYLYFSLLLFFLSAARFINPLTRYLYPNYPLLDEKIGYLNLAWPFIILSFIQFVRYFFRLSERYPRFSKLLLLTGFIDLILNSTFDFLDPDYLLSNSTHTGWGVITGVADGLIYCSIVVVFFLYLRQKSKVTKLVVVAGLPLALLWGIAMPTMSFYFFLYTKYGVPMPALITGTAFLIFEIISIAWFVILFSLILFMRFNNLRKENAQHALDRERLAKEKEIERALLIEQQKVELEKQVAKRTTELKQSLEELKATQKQLIQSEKMASLGELTAGIAHEIQNPLNFVNNFSEVSNELIDEIKIERSKAKGERDKELEDEILNDIKQNLEKINHHGKRADAIVKGMLQHSRISSGVKEPKDINALCDEYVRLSYHGLRAKDKSFNADFKTEFDESIGKINIIPQDIGRVLLNLYNNAFYAVNEKNKTTDENYKPLVLIQTKKINGKVEIKVEDNGSGIPKNIIDKIFHPFFTTKPTGQGTGLGLSLSYDIIKAHGGEIKVETKENEGSEFVIQIPV